MAENMAATEEVTEETTSEAEVQQEKQITPESEKEFTKADVEKAIENARKQWAAEQDQAARLAKLSKDERDKEQLRLDREQLDKEKAEFQRKQLVAETAEQLAEKGLSRAFAENICGKDAEETKAKIDILAKDWSANLEKAVDERLKGKPPKQTAGAENSAGGEFADIIKQNQRI